MLASVKVQELKAEVNTLKERLADEQNAKVIMHEWQSVYGNNAYSPRVCSPPPLGYNE